MIGKVLITGGAGFIGLHLAKRLLAEGYRVHLVDNFARGVRDPEFDELSQLDAVSLSNIDCLNIEQLSALPRDFDYIFHLAAIVGVANVAQRPYQVLMDNVKLTDNVIQLAKMQRGLKRFLFSSTSEVYAGSLECFTLKIPTPESESLAITELVRPRTSYMLSKICGEFLSCHSEIPFTIFRPHNIYGPRMGMSHVVPEHLYRAYIAKERDVIKVASARQTRSFCYIDDAIEQLFLMMTHVSCEGKTLNLGTEGPEITIKELVEICHQAIGRKLTILAEPSMLGSPERRAPDMTHTTQAIGFSSKITLMEGINKTYGWYRDKLFKGRGISAI